MRNLKKRSAIVAILDFNLNKKKNEETNWCRILNASIDATNSCRSSPSCVFFSSFRFVRVSQYEREKQSVAQYNNHRHSHCSAVVANANHTNQTYVLLLRFGVPFVRFILFCFIVNIDSFSFFSFLSLHILLSLFRIPESAKYIAFACVCVWVCSTSFGFQIVFYWFCVLLHRSPKLCALVFHSRKYFELRYLFVQCCSMTLVSSATMMLRRFGLTLCSRHVCTPPPSSPWTMAIRTKILNSDKNRGNSKRVRERERENWMTTVKL